MASIRDCRLIDLPKIQDRRGNLSFLEGNRHVPFEIVRAFWIYDVPGGAVRGGHAYRVGDEAVIALSGSFEIMLDDGHHKVRYTMSRSYHALLVPGPLWRQMINFSTNSVALVLASRPFCEEEYVRHYDEYLALKVAK